MNLREQGYFQTYRNWRLAVPTHSPSPPPGAGETLLVMPFQLCLKSLRPVKPPCFFSGENLQGGRGKILTFRGRGKKHLHNIFLFFFLKSFDRELHLYSKVKRKEEMSAWRNIRFYPKPDSHLLGYVPWAHWEWLHAVHSSTLTAQFPDRGESEAQPGTLRIMFKQQGLDWLCILVIGIIDINDTRKGHYLVRSIKQFMYESHI